MQKLIMIVWCLFFLVACAAHRGNEKFSTEESISYSETKNLRQQAKAFIPRGEGPFPGVLLVHGGGWSSRSLNDMDSIAESLASHGFSVFSINYRYSPEARHPAPIEDLDKALDHFKRNWQHYKLDRKRVGLWGYSSGGHTVSYFALMNANDKNKKVQAVVAGGAPFDLTWYPFSPYVKEYIGKYRDDALDEYFKASPAYMISETAPPFFLYHARYDKRVEHAQSTAFEAKLKQKGIRASVHTVPYGGHTIAFVFADGPVKKGIEFFKAELRSREESSP